MTDDILHPRAAAAEGSDELDCRRAGRTLRVTVTQIRRGLQPSSDALDALARVTGVGVLRRVGADQFVAGPLPLCAIEQAGAQIGEVLAWDGASWSPTAAGGAARHRRGGAPVLDLDGTCLELGAEHDATVLRLTAGAEVTATLSPLPPAGCELTVLQAGDGAVRFVPAAGASLANRSGHARTAGRHARVTLMVAANRDGRSAAWILSGDTGP